MTACPALEEIAAWVLGELGSAEAERFEEHYFGCDACLARALELERLVVALNENVPVLLTQERRRRLEASGRAVATVALSPGDRGVLHLGKSAEIGIWVLAAPLADVARVDLEARAPDGALCFLLPDVPFDANRGEVLLPCQSHFRAQNFPDPIHVRLIADGRGKILGEYILEHVYEEP